MFPGPNKYNPEFRLVKPRAVDHFVGKPPVKKGWKPEKAKGPDVGTYECKDTFKKIKQRPQSAIVLKEVAKTFNDIAIKQVKHVPGVGSYDPTKCYDHIARPMRCSRR